MCNMVVKGQPNNVKWSTFNPQPVKFEGPDVSIVQESIRRVNERANMANEKYVEFNQYLYEIYDQLAPDEETQNWFHNLVDHYTKELDKSFRFGNYGQAYRDALEFKSELMRNNEVLARIRSWEEYKNSVSVALRNNRISETTKQIWLEMNPYKFVPVKNSQGNTITYKPFEVNYYFNFSTGGYPVEDINWESLIYDYVRISGGNVSKIKDLLRMDVKDVIGPEHKKAYQDYSEALYIYNKYKKEMNTTTSLSRKSFLELKMSEYSYLISSAGYEIDFDTYVDKIAEMILRQHGIDINAKVQKDINNNSNGAKKRINTIKRTNKPSSTRNNSRYTPKKRYSNYKRK